MMGGTVGVVRKPPPRNDKPLEQILEEFGLEPLFIKATDKSHTESNNLQSVDEDVHEEEEYYDAQKQFDDYNKKDNINDEPPRTRDVQLARKAFQSKMLRRRVSFSDSHDSDSQSGPAQLHSCHSPSCDIKVGHCNLCDTVSCDIGTCHASSCDTGHGSASSCDIRHTHACSCEVKQGCGHSGETKHGQTCDMRYDNSHLCDISECQTSMREHMSSSDDLNDYGELSPLQISQDSGAPTTDSGAPTTDSEGNTESSREESDAISSDEDSQSSRRVSTYSCQSQLPEILVTSPDSSRKVAKSTLKKERKKVIRCSSEDTNKKVRYSTSKDDANAIKKVGSNGKAKWRGCFIPGSLDFSKARDKQVVQTPKVHRSPSLPAPSQYKQSTPLRNPTRRSPSLPASNSQTTLDKRRRSSLYLMKTVMREGMDDVVRAVEIAKPVRAMKAAMQQVSFKREDNIKQVDNEVIEEEKKEDCNTYEHYSRLEDAFEIHDKNQKGFLTKEELRSCLRTLGHNPTEPQIWRFMAQVDVDHSGTLDFEEFFNLMSTMMGEWDPEEDLSICWRALDPGGRGTIAVPKLRNLLTRFGAQMPNEELESLLGEVNQLDEINYEQFMDAVVKTRVQEESPS